MTKPRPSVNKLEITRVRWTNDEGVPEDYIAHVIEEPSRQNHTEDPEMVAKVEKLLSMLPDRWRDVVIMRAEGLRWAEIAEMVGYSSGSTAHRIYDSARVRILLQVAPYPVETTTDKVVRLRESGKTWREIAEVFGAKHHSHYQKLYTAEIKRRKASPGS